jgi:DNA invertase Pin-like site-specific DNA recombinase
MRHEMVRDIVLAVMASRAKRARISERTKAALARVRARGTRLGRPALSDNVRVRIAELVHGEPSMTAYAIAKAMGCDVKTAAKYASGARSAP